MPRKARRAKTALRVEVLERRALLTLSITGSPAGPVVPTPLSSTILVRFLPNTPPHLSRSDLAAVDGKVVQSYPDGPSVVSLSPGEDPATAVQQLESTGEVSYAELDGAIHATDVVPNDPLYPQLWALSNPDGVDINAQQAWGVTVGNPALIIAVLDTGIDVRNPEFYGRIWTNPNPWGDAGYPNDRYGWNFVNNNSNIQDNNGHGTHVTGTIAADGNNGIGVTGINWMSQIMPLKVLDAFGNGSTDVAVAAIYFAVNHGARVINASWGGGPYSQAMHDAIAYADSRGVVFVVAAGNDSSNNDVVATYPSSYRLPNELVVAAVDSSGNLADFSNYGANTVDLAAPGVNIVSTVPGGYATYSGTSMATPQVTGVVSLLLGLHPEYNAEQVIHQVLANTKPLPSLAGRTITGGMVDAYFTLTGGGSVRGAGGSSPVSSHGSSDIDVQAAIAAWKQQSDADFVTEAFAALLDRAPDPSGFNYFMGQLAQGVSRIAVAQAIQNTPEGQLAAVAHWFQDDFGSNLSIAQLEGDPRVQFWAGIVANYGLDLAQAGILSTDAYYLSQGGTSAGYINGLFQALLGRAADPASINYFSGLLQSGVSLFDVARIIQGTPEGQLTRVARWFQDEYAATQSLADLKASPGVAYWAGFLND